MKVIDVEFNFVENVGTMEEEAEKYRIKMENKE